MFDKKQGFLYSETRFAHNHADAPYIAIYVPRFSCRVTAAQKSWHLNGTNENHVCGISLLASVFIQKMVLAQKEVTLFGVAKNNTFCKTSVSVNQKRMREDKPVKRACQNTQNLRGITVFLNTRTIYAYFCLRHDKFDLIIKEIRFQGNLKYQNPRRGLVAFTSNKM